MTGIEERGDDADGFGGGVENGGAEGLLLLVGDALGLFPWGAGVR